jgi:hypothetical protein
MVANCHLLNYCSFAALQKKTKQRSARIKQKRGKQILRKSRIMHNAGRRSYFRSFPSFFDSNHKSNKRKKKIMKTRKKEKNKGSVGD